MESLGDVLKQLPLTKRRVEAEQRVAELLRHPLVLQFRAEHPELTDSDIKLNMNKLYQYVKELGSCENCPGLEQCPHDFQGHYTKLTVETMNGHTIIDDRKTPCQKLLTHEKQQMIYNRVHAFHVDELALKQGYSAEEIIKRDYERIQAVQAIMEYIVDVKKNGLNPNGMYLVGGFGTGKTFLMSYMLYELARSGYTGAIVYMPEFVEDLKSMFQEPKKLKETMDLLKECDILVLDDIGAENMSAWVRDHVLGTILNHRMNRKPTFYTSNYDLDALLKHFTYTRDGEDVHKAERLMNRIQPFVTVVPVLGRNKRNS